MIETLSIIAVAVLAVLTVGTLFPLIPSGVLAAGTVLAYWWQTGYTSPNVLVVISLAVLGLTVTVTDFASGAVAGKLGGASNMSVGVGSIIGMILLFVVGPIGFLLGVAGSVFAFSLYGEDDDVRAALKKSIYTVIGVLASKIVQFLMMALITVSFGFFVLI